MASPPGQWGGWDVASSLGFGACALEHRVPGPLHPVSPQAPNSLLNPRRREPLSPCPELCSERPASIQTGAFFPSFSRTLPAL